MFIDLRSVKRESQLAYAQGIRYLMSNILPSMWHPEGGGWQEHWGADYAGFYASCDGVLLLSARPPGVPESEIPRSVLPRVYSNHLCQVLDDATQANTPEKERMRTVCTKTVFKLSKFIQASSSIADFIAVCPDVVDKARSILVNASKPEGGWPACIDTSRKQAVVISATCEATIALAQVRAVGSDGFIDDSLQRGIDFLLEVLKKSVDWKRQMAAFWTLTETCVILHEPNDAVLRPFIDLALSAISERSDDLLTDTFQNSLGNGDYYHLNVRFNAAQALLNLIWVGVAPLGIMGLVASVVQDIVNSIMKNGRYLRDDSAEGPRFWEHYQAMAVLATFLRVLQSQPQIAERKFMWVSPRHFEPNNLTEEDNYAVVLMPFTPPWSGDVFNSIKEAAQSKGVRVWRSDVSFKDEKIVQRIWEEMCKAKFIIADCTGRNPNVFYELGIAHTLGKPVFICAQKRKDIPFDLTAIRSFDYGGPMLSQLRLLQASLSSFIDEL